MGATYLLAEKEISGGIGSGLSNWSNTNKTFDSSVFNLPRTINGNVMISVPWIKDDNDNDGVSGTVYKVNAAGDATSLGNFSSNTITGTDTFGICSATVLITNKIIKKGEKLRVYFNFPGNGESLYCSFDPGDRTWSAWGGSATITNIYGATRVYVPFKIDL
jgi:hypothetical protein